VCVTFSLTHSLTHSLTENSPQPASKQARREKLYNFDISGESNQRNKFVKCFEHYFPVEGKFIVYVQVELYPASQTLFC